MATIKRILHKSVRIRVVTLAFLWEDLSEICAARDGGF